MNLIQEHGPNYFYERCRGSIFIHPDGWVGTVVNAGQEDVLVKKIEGNVGKLSVSETSLPADFFSSLAVFDVPELGWRTALNGRVLTYYGRLNSYSRGVSPGRTVSCSHSDMTYHMMENRAVSRSYFERYDVQAKMITTPDYLTLAEGCGQMREGTIASFAMGPHLAVSASDEDNIGILYVRYTAVGTVNLREATLSADVNIIRRINPQQQEAVA